VSTPKAPRELRQKLKNGDITEEEFERQRLAIKNGAARTRLSIESSTPSSELLYQSTPDSPDIALSRQFSEMMDPEVCNESASARYHHTLTGRWVFLPAPPRLASRLLLTCVLCCAISGENPAIKS